MAIVSAFVLPALTYLIELIIALVWILPDKRIAQVIDKKKEDNA